MGKYSPLTLKKYEAYRVSELSPFNAKYIHFTRTFKDGTNDIANFSESQHFDAFVVGSDQTWRPSLSPDLYHMFCDFVSPTSKVKRIAYAASFGLDTMSFTQAQLNRCIPLLQRFKAVGVREASGVDLCKQYFNVDATQVLDPTMLLDKEDYLKLISNYSPNHKEIDFMQYVFFWKHDEKAIIDKVSRIINCKPTNLFPEKFLKEIESKEDLELAKFQPLEEWLYGYSRAKFVVTDSFHGTVFCIIFNVPFLVVSPDASTRLKSLLSLFGLENRFIMTEDQVTPELVNETTDWEMVNSCRDKLKGQSLSFLKRALAD